MAKQNSSGNGAVIAGLTTVAAAAVGAFWLYGSEHAEKHRKIAKSWMLKARAEVMDAVEKMKEVDKATYLATVDQIMKKYAQVQKDSKDVALMTKEMKSAWSHIQLATKPAKNIANKAVKKVVKKVKSATK